MKKYIEAIFTAILGLILIIFSLPIVKINKQCISHGGSSILGHYYPKSLEVNIEVETNSIFSIKRGLIWVDVKNGATEKIEINDTKTDYSVEFSHPYISYGGDPEDVKVTVKFILFDNIPYLIIGIIILINALFRIRRIYWEAEEEKRKQE